MEIHNEEVVVQDPATGSTQVSQTTEQVASPAEVQVAKAEKKNQIVWYVVGIINALLILRLLFLLLGAKDTGFASMLYTVTNPIVNLFKGIFAAPRVDSSYFDTAALLAIVIITLLGWGISALVDVMHRPAPARD
jgi:hypothetical protein